MKIVVTFFVLIFAVSMTGLAQNRSFTDSVVIVKKKFIVNDTLLKEIDTVFSFYQDVCAGLEKASIKRTNSDLKDLLDALDKVGQERMTIQQHKKFNSVVPELKEAVKEMMRREDLKTQHSHFNSLSAALWKILKLFNAHQDGLIYWNVCDGEIQWISKERNSRTPYKIQNQQNCVIPKDSIY